MKYARIIDNVAVDVIDDEPSKHFHPDLVSDFVAVPEFVRAGARRVDGEWVNLPPEEPALEVPAPVVYPTVSPVEFEMLWTIPELIAIDQLRSTDPVLDRFMKRLENPKLTQVNLALESVQLGVEYTLGWLAANQTVAPEDIAVRMEAILSGVVK